MSEQVAGYLAGFAHDPLKFAMAAFPWGEGELAAATGPRQWQQEELDQIGRHLRNPETRHTPYFSATVSGNGPGKSALVAMIAKWALSTCEDARVIITANTGSQLSNKTQPEVAKWFRLAIDADLWDVQAKRISSIDQARRANWRLDFETWSEENPESLAGLHNVGKRIVIIFDEASAIPRIIWETIKGALTDENTEILWFVFGNGTLNEGPFYECFQKNSRIWHTRHIDTRTVEGTNKTEIAEWIEEEGEDSDWIRVHVRGLFPRHSELQFIGHDVIDKARKYVPTGYEELPKILAVDIARFGGDETVFGLRQGRCYQQIDQYRRQDTTFTANRVIELMEKFKPAATIVDADGIGAAVIDFVRSMGYEVIPFNGNGPAYKTARFGNRRAEVWAAGRAWLESGGRIPNDEEIAHQLGAPHYYYRTGTASHGALMLERKDDMRKRGEKSPDRADTLMLTFAVNPMAKQDNRPQHEYSRQVIQGGWMSV